MADDEQGAAIRPQEAHQPFLGVDVEVIGRLVEAQHVAPGEEDAGQLDAPAFATRQHADRRVDAPRADPEPGRQRSRLAVSGVAASRAEMLLGPGVAGDVALVRSLLHGDAQLLESVERLVDPSAGQDVGYGAAAVEHAGDARVLRQVAEAALADDASRRRLHLVARARARGSSCRRRCGRQDRPWREA